MKNRDDAAGRPRNKYNILTFFFPSLVPVERRNLLFFLSFTMFAFASWLWLFAGTSIAGVVKLREGDFSEPPVAVTKNGSYAGVYDEVYKQDYFLGVPYALPPTGEGRFRIPQSLNGSWTRTRDAKSYSKECVGYGVRYCFLYRQTREWERVSMYANWYHRATNGPMKSRKIVFTSMSFDRLATRTPSCPLLFGFMVVGILRVVAWINAIIFLSLFKTLWRLGSRLLVLVSTIDSALGDSCIRGRYRGVGIRIWG